MPRRLNDEGIGYIVAEWILHFRKDRYRHRDRARIAGSLFNTVLGEMSLNQPVEALTAIFATLVRTFSEEAKRTSGLLVICFTVGSTTCDGRLISLEGSTSFTQNRAANAVLGASPKRRQPRAGQARFQFKPGCCCHAACERCWEAQEILSA
jgi:hypothetical protein